MAVLAFGYYQNSLFSSSIQMKASEMRVQFQFAIECSTEIFPTALD